MENSGFRDPAKEQPTEHTWVKVLVHCEAQGLKETLRAYFRYGNYEIEGAKGPCFKVIGWAKPGDVTENFSTERL